MAHITGDTYPLGPEDVGLQVSVRVTLQGPSGREAKSDATSSMVRVDPCPSPNPYPHPHPKPKPKPSPSPSPSPSPHPSPHPSPEQVGVGESYKAQLTEWSVRQGERAFAVLMPSLGEKVGVRARVRVKVRVRVRVRVAVLMPCLGETEGLLLFNAGSFSLTLAVTP